jgi:hypothetical protein
MAAQAVYAIVGNRQEAETLIQALVDSGVRPQDISFLSSQGKEFYDFSTSRPSGDTARNWRTEKRHYPIGKKAAELMQEGYDAGGLGIERHTKAPEATTAGVVTGGIIGGALGLLAGIGALAIPGVGPFLAAGPIMATLAGIGSGGTIGGIIGALVGVGIPEYEAKRYESRLKQGGILVSVHAINDDQAKNIKELLEKNGAEDVTLSTEAYVTKQKR